MPPAAARAEPSPKVNEITRGYFQRTASLAIGAVADDMRAVAKEGFKRLLDSQKEGLKGKVKEGLKGLFNK